jgi:hypothetical protein
VIPEDVSCAVFFAEDVCGAGSSAFLFTPELLLSVCPVEIIMIYKKN